MGKNSGERKRIAPWEDFNGNEIVEDCEIIHPTGDRGRVYFVPDGEVEEDQWVVDYGEGALSRLCLQVGDKGRALVIQ